MYLEFFPSGGGRREVSKALNSFSYIVFRDDEINCLTLSGWTQFATDVFRFTHEKVEHW